MKFGLRSIGVAFFASTLVLSSAFADDTASTGRITTSAYCQTVQLNAKDGSVELMIRQEGPLFSSAPFILSTTREGQTVTVKGLQVELVRSSLIDEETVHGFGLAGPFTIHNRHFGVKLQISADEAIGMKIDGCIGRPVKELTVYTTCVDAESQHGRL